MNHKASVAIAALALGTSGTALAAPDSCDDGGQYLTGAYTVREDTSYVTSFQATANADNLGRAIATGDFNDDGVQDVAIGAIGVDTNGESTGAVYVYFGQLNAALESAGATGHASPVDAEADVVLTGEAYGDRTGFALATGELDGSPGDDLVIGSSAAAGASGGAGIVHVVYGGTITGSTAIDLATQADARIFGEYRGDGFGTVVSVVGDLDGDGYDDVVIGAPTYSVGLADRGAAYVFYGGAFGDDMPAATTASARIEGLSATGRFGSAIAGVGLFDADNFADFAVGAPADSTAASRAGALFVFSGGNPRLSAGLPSDIAFASIYGSYAFRCGASVLSAGDVDIDGNDDLWIGCKQAGTGKEGLVSLVRGADVGGVGSVFDLGSTQVWGQGVNGTAGSSLASGDFNQDGIADLLVGGERAGGEAFGSGAAWIAYGPFRSNAIISLGAVKFSGSAFEDFVGSAVAAGDVNGDGYDDVFVGGWRSSLAGFHAGTVAMYLGGSDTADMVTWYEDADSDGFGATAVTQAACSDTPPNVGGVSYVRIPNDCLDSDAQYYPGAPELCTDPDFNCDGSNSSLSGIPLDQDGDGVVGCATGSNVPDCNDADAAISPNSVEVCNLVDDDCDGDIDAADLSVAGDDARTFYVDVDGDGYGPTSSLTKVCGDTAPFPHAVLLAGDCNDDPLTGVDVNPASPEMCGDGVDNDCANGTDDAFSLDAQTFWRDSDADGYGDPTDATLACARLPGFSDNRQDCDDAAPSIQPSAVETCDYVDNNCDGMNYIGGDDTIVRAHATFLGADTNDNLRAAGFLGDQDFDGDDELILIADHNGAFAADGGVVYLKNGGVSGGDSDLGALRADGSGWWDARFYATRRGSAFGRSVTHGDYNGDLIEDIAIGAPWAHTPQSFQGAVYIFYGPITSGDYKAEDADVILRGEKQGTNTGTKVETGDFDSDGYDDLLVQASTYTGPSPSGMPNQGRVYLVYGNAGLAGNQRIDQIVGSNVLKTFTGLATGDAVGSTFAVGDFDGDANQDFVVGSETAGGLFAPGAAYVFYGSGGRPAGDTLTPSATLVGENSDRLGLGLANAGDTNNDGADDLLLGTNNPYVYFVLGNSTRLSGAGIRVHLKFDIRFGTGFGTNHAAFGLGDINQDNLDDFAIMAPTLPNGLDNDVGALFIVYGRSDYTEIVPTGGLFALENLESFGRVDPNGATLAFDGGPVVWSATNLNVLEGGKILGAKAGDGFGYTAGRGDFDGDGFPDYAVSSPNFDRNALDTNNGKVYLFLGGSYGDDVFVTDTSAETWWWDYDADSWTTDQSFVACGMHRPISFKNPAAPVPRGWHTQTARLDCDDRDDTIYPGATEATGVDGEDTDCDGYDIPNVLPVLTLTLTPAAPLSTDTLSAAVDIDDDDPIVTPITLQYEWYRDGVLIPNQNSSTLLPTNFVKGSTIKVRVRADDTRGLTAWKEATVNINNSLPSLASCTVTPNAAGVGTDLTVTAAGIADDDAADGPFLTTTYQWQMLRGLAWLAVDGQTATQLAACTSRNVPPANPSSINNCYVGSMLRAICTPHDPSEFPGPQVVSNVITIQNTRPSITSCAVSPASATTTTDLSAIASATDPDAETVAITYEWFVNETSVGTGPTLSNTVTSHFDQVQVKCTPRDAYGDFGTTVTSSPITINNTAPTGVTIDLLPDYPHSNQDLFVNITQPSSDADGDSITYFYYWRKDNAPFNNPTYPSQVSTLLESSTKKGEGWSVTVVPNDGFADGQSSNDSVFILNTAPTITGALVSPTSPRSDQAVTAVAVGYFDHDGDPPQNKYQWWIDGSPVPAAAGGTAQVLPALPGRRGKSVYVVITADDGDANQDGNSITSAATNYVNSPPYAAVLNALTPNQPSEEDDLVCTFQSGSTDYDNDALTYRLEWWRFRPADPVLAPNGAGTYTRVADYPGLTSTTSAQYTLGRDETLYADRFYCKVTPNDGAADGPSAQSPEKAINDLDAPAQPTINAIERYRNNTSVTLSGTCESYPNDCFDLYIQCTDDLNVSQTISYVDPGGQPLTAATSWCQGGTFSRSVPLTRGRNYTCTAWCYDVGMNRSLNASSRQTDVCSSTQYDAWEVDGTPTSHGDTQTDAITGTLAGDGTTMAQWGILADTNASTVTVIGNILGAGIEWTPADQYDWYFIRTSDSYTADAAAGVNVYNFEIDMDQGTNDYQIQVYRDTVNGLGTLQCPLAGSYDDFNFYNWDRLDYPANTATARNTDHTTPANRQYCDGNLTGAYNQCTDYTSNYYVRVSRETAQSCANYRLQVRNGDPSWQ